MLICGDLPFSGRPLCASVTHKNHNNVSQIKSVWCCNSRFYLHALAPETVLTTDHSTGCSQGSDGTGTHRNAVPVFFGARNGVPVFFSRRRTLYLLLFNTRFLFLCSVRCALHVACQSRSVIKLTAVGLFITLARQSGTGCQLAR